jgi:hypothetical protein
MKQVIQFRTLDFILLEQNCHSASLMKAVYIFAFTECSVVIKLILGSAV